MRESKGENISNMHTLFKKIFLFLFCLLSCATTFAREERVDSLKIFFRQNSARWEADFENNGERMESFLEHIRTIQQDTLQKIIKVTYVAGASPEGPLSFNQRISKQRAKSIMGYINQRVRVANTVVETILRDEDYGELIRLVENDAQTPHREQVLQLLRTLPTSEVKSHLMQLHNGESWQYMLDTHFPLLRCFKMTVVVGVEPPQFPTEEPVQVASAGALTAASFSALPTPVVAKSQVSKGWIPQLSLKTNAFAWAMGVTNVAIEVDFAKHLSFNLPVYYSAWNYFTYGIKFRLLGLYPEVRYWFAERDGWFVGAHFGTAIYNMALNGDWRIQDHNGNTPALGGGINAGYRMPISKDKRWKVEFTLGLGVYDVHYDKFLNYKDGPQAVGSVRKAAFAVDNVGVNFSYSFDLKKR